ncbi:MAG: enoyl-CoA hydratase/isomerase family protein [Pseudomonadota bacterium]
MTDSLILSETAGSIASITINRAAKRNAVTNAMMQALIAEFDQLAANTSVRAVVLRAKGEDFSVGADLDALQTSLNESDDNLLQRRRNAELGARLMRALCELPQPTICALQGVATGAGACIAIGCDFRVVATDTTLGFGEVRMGMNLMWGALPLVVELMGPARAKRLLMSGERIDAQHLEAWGLVDRMCDRDDVRDVAYKLAQQYAALPPVAVQMIKRSVNQYALAFAASASHMDADQWLLTTQSSDFEEAIRSFKEKRAPRFAGD